VSGGGWKPELRRCARGWRAFNCILTGNLAWSCACSGSGGGAYRSTLYNCTVTSNSAWTDGGIAYSKLYNSIVYFNQAPNGANYFAPSTFAYSCTLPLPPGPGNIAADPRLITASHLLPSSTSVGGRANASKFSMEPDASSSGTLEPSHASR